MASEPEMGFCGEPNCEEYWIECAVCGCEFCSKCFPNSNLCAECAQMAELEAEEEEPDFDDVPNLKALIQEDDDAEENSDEERDARPL